MIKKIISFIISIVQKNRIMIGCFYWIMIDLYTHWKFE